MSYFLLFFCTFLLLLLLQTAATFPDPDSFYHAKMAVLIKEQGIVKDFPWTQFAVLKDYYIDHHFLYHIALLPFIWVLPTFVGVKLATIFFASLTITVFFWLLKRLSIRYAALYAIILLGTNAFTFRLNLAKAQALALILLFVGIYFVVEKKYLWLFVVSFLYVWLYGGWPLLLFVAVMYCLARLWEQRKKLKAYFADSFKVLGVIICGNALAIFTSPYFPKNLYFYWQQIYEIAVVNYREIIGVGGEWYAYKPLHLIAHANIAFLLLVVGLTFFALNIKRQKALSVFFLLLTLIFIVLTLRARRNVEYLIPFTILFAAVVLENFFRNVDAKKFWRDFLQFARARKSFLIAVIFPLLLFPYVVIRDIRIVKNAYDNGFSFHRFEKSSLWLAQNTPSKSIVFTSDWDEFPFLFYYNTNNYYIVGLDPTFMYKYDTDLYWKWERITTVKDSRNVYEIVKNDFDAEYVFVSLSDHEKFDGILQKDNRFEPVYSDSEANIYKVL